jgi:hypothetical protein
MRRYVLKGKRRLGRAAWNRKGRRKLNRPRRLREALPDVQV